MRARSTPERKKELRRQRQLRAYARRRAYAREYLGGACAECGTDEGLQFDHVDPTTKRFDLFGSRWSMAWQRWHDELDQCQLLCTSCHSHKTTEYRIHKRKLVVAAAIRRAAAAEVPF